MKSKLKYILFVGIVLAFAGSNYSCNRKMGCKANEELNSAFNKNGTPKRKKPKSGLFEK